jgi:hypothetical protein
VPISQTNDPALVDGPPAGTPGQGGDGGQDALPKPPDSGTEVGDEQNVSFAPNRPSGPTTSSDHEIATTSTTGSSPSEPGPGGSAPAVAVAPHSTSRDAQPHGHRGDGGHGGDERGTIAVDPAELQDLVSLMNGVAREYREVSALVAAHDGIQAVPPGLRPHVAERLSDIRAQLESLAGELEESGRDLRLRASVLEELEHDHIGSAAQRTAAVFGPGSGGGDAP